MPQKDIEEGEAVSVHSLETHMREEILHLHRESLSESGLPITDAILRESVSQNIPWLSQIQNWTHAELEHVLQEHSTEDVFQVHNVLTAVTSHKGHRATSADQFGSFWLSSAVPQPAKSPIRLRDSQDGSTYTRDSYMYWRYHYTPFGVSHKVKGYGIASHVLCAVDTLRFIQVHAQSGWPFADNAILFIGESNEKMAHFAQKRLGAHVQKTNFKRQIHTIVQSIRRKNSIGNAVKSAWEKNYSIWIPADELFSNATQDALEAYIQKLERMTMLDRHEMEHESRVQAILYMIGKKRGTS